MEILASPSAAAVRPFLSYTAAIRKRNFAARSKLNDDNDSLFQAAIERASLRFQESLRPDPLFIDHYAGCLVPANNVTRVDIKPQVPLYCVATKFIDDKLLNALNNDDELRQVVLFTDGMDTRPYRLHWPRSTVIFDISPERVFRTAIVKLEDVEAKIGRSCLFIHIPLESYDIETTMCNKGFKGTACCEFG